MFYIEFTETVIGKVIIDALLLLLLTQDSINTTKFKLIMVPTFYLIVICFLCPLSNDKINHITTFYAHFAVLFKRPVDGVGQFHANTVAAVVKNFDCI